MNKMDFVAIVLAAGLGTRMKSSKAKVLHEVAEKPLVGWCVDAVLAAGAARAIVVVGHQREAVSEYLQKHYPSQVDTVVQEQQRGTGDAVRVALPKLDQGEESVVIAYGDCPLLEPEAVRALVLAKEANKLSLLVSTLKDPTGYGRILRQDGKVLAIREEKDASPDEKKLTEVNPGVYAVDSAFLRTAVTALEAKNAAGELYLTDVVARAATTGEVATVPWPMESLRGINDRSELVWAEAQMQKRIAARHGAAGVTIRNPASTVIGAEVELAPDVTVEANVVLRGRTSVASGAVIDVGSVIEDSKVGEGAWIKPYCVIAQSNVGSKSQVGPFAHLRTGTQLEKDVRVGNFVETKKTVMHEASKANHLAYLGDGLIGAGANIGAGTIFCNYDGANKHTTTIEADAFVGSDSQLVAPVTVGRGSYVATGTTVTRDVPPDALAVGRAKQENKEGYARRLRARLGIKTRS